MKCLVALAPRWHLMILYKEDNQKISGGAIISIIKKTHKRGTYFEEKIDRNF